MDLSVFLILLFVTLQFVAEYHSWNQYRVKLGLFIATAIITLPNIIFMVIDWWESPHSKIALLVLNTFKPILRGETFRLFRWLKSVGMGLTSDELNYLPISIPSISTNFFMTRNCFEKVSETTRLKVIPEDESYWLGSRISGMSFTKCTGFIYRHENRTFKVHQVRISRKLVDLWANNDWEGFTSHPSFESSWVLKSQVYTNVDVPSAKRLNMRLIHVCNNQIPILAEFERKREWVFFHAASTLDCLNDDLVFIEARGDAIAVG